MFQFRLWIGGGSIADMKRLQASIQQQLTEVTRLVERNILLEAEVQALKKFPNAVEEQARSELGFIKKGETFCQIIHKKDFNE